MVGDNNLVREKRTTRKASRNIKLPQEFSSSRLLYLFAWKVSVCLSSSVLPSNQFIYIFTWLTKRLLSSFFGVVLTRFCGCERDKRVGRNQFSLSLEGARVCFFLFSPEIFLSLTNKKNSQPLFSSRVISFLKENKKKLLTWRLHQIFTSYYRLLFDCLFTLLPGWDGGKNSLGRCYRNMSFYTHLLK